MPKYGILVAEDGDDVSGGQILRLDSKKVQFKYKKIIDFKFPMPAVAIGTDYNRTIQAFFREDQGSIGYVPAYEYYLQAYNGNWGIPPIASPQAYESSNPDFPFYKSNEYVTSKLLNIRIFIQNQNLNPPYTPVMNYPAYEATLRVIITFDNLAKL